MAREEKHRGLFGVDGRISVAVDGLFIHVLRQMDGLSHLRGLQGAAGWRLFASTLDCCQAHSSLQLAGCPVEKAC